ncbi:iron-siderophore ABC transporter substrate-binding protein [Nesterenkonia sp. F]|uniref:iron-siderophore ABC transporter substrate-binding protein n=1 Tax=Nesterenkonia sp. F TaxID=795955 RepID=UPI000255C8B4|nr:iron-siderophore ABC transporter substrate-binding protein [Nesterenkonia sp. F]
MHIPRHLSGSSAVVSVLAAASLALTACGGSAEEPDGSDGGSAGGTLASVEHKFGTTEVPEPEDGELDVVALGWSDAEVALSLGVKPIAVHDWLSFGEENHGVGPWAAEEFGDAEPTVIPRSDDELDYEQIQAMDPDLILNVNSSYDEAEYDRLSEIAPTVSGPEDAENFNPGWQNQVQLIADALGRSEEGEQVVSDTEDDIAAVAEEHPEFAELTAVTGSKFGEAYGLSYSGDLRWDLIEALGFRMYGPAAETEPDEGFFANISAENVDVFEADVAVLFPIGYTLQDLQDDELISSLDVVQDDRAVMLDPDEDLVQAFSAGSPQSIQVVLDELPDRLADAASNVEE